MATEAPVENTTEDSDDFNFLFRVTYANGWTIEEGKEIADKPLPDDAKLHALGEMLINLGTRLLKSTVGEWDEVDDDYESDYEDEDEE